LRAIRLAVDERFFNGRRDLIEQSVGVCPISAMRKSLQLGDWIQ
jgi:hypothetical protein